MKPFACPKCHHFPSGRHSGDYNARCYCRCHDVTDAAPELLAACELIVAGWGHQDGVSAAVVAARAAIASARREVL